MLRWELFVFRIFYLVWIVLIFIINCLKKICKINILEWVGLCRFILLLLRSYDRYFFINLLIFVVGDNNFDVMKGKLKDYYNLFIREKVKLFNII